MTLEDIKNLVIAVDPDAGHYESAYRGTDAYTEWREKGTLPIMGDNRHAGGWRFQIDRFTKAEGDAIAAAIMIALEDRDDVAFEYIPDYEPDTGYIHHIYDCEGI